MVVNEMCYKTGCVRTRNFTVYNKPFCQSVQLRLLQRRSPNIMVKFVSCSADNQGHAQSVSLSEDSRPQAISYHFQNPQTACFLPLSLCLLWNKVMRVENDTFGYPLIQKVVQNQLSSLVISILLRPGEKVRKMDHVKNHLNFKNAKRWLGKIHSKFCP